jgi:hypothetical protein
METTTGIQPRVAMTRHTATRRVSFTECPREPARSVREQPPPPQTAERRRVTQTRPTPHVSTLLLRVQSEYREMPGLKLTEAQARRLWDLDGDTCSLVLTTLLEERFLKCTPNGTYVRKVD